MTTYNDLIDRIENAVNDASNATFSAAVVGEWLHDAIREYSQHFPRSAETTISTSLDDRKYDLPADLQEVEWVEYPDAEDPPERLRRREHTHPAFWLVDGYYDVIHHHDAADVAELWISTKPAAAETIRVAYTYDHDATITGTDTVTVPDRHEPILIKYCVWQAAKYLEEAEEQSPTSNSSLLMAQLAQNAYRAERTYYDALRRALTGRRGRSARVRWQLDKYDRIY